MRLRTPAVPGSVESPRTLSPLEAGHELLLGSWAAVRWEYTCRDGARRVDVVVDLGGTVTLSITADSYVLSWVHGSDGAQSTGGTISVIGDDHIDFRPRSGDPERVDFRRATGTLVLRSDSSSWDFDGRGEEAAAFSAVMVRL